MSNRNIKKANNVINSFINSDIYDIVKYCHQNKIDINTFNLYLDIIKENNKDLYNQYIYKCTTNKHRNFIFMLSIARTIINYLKNGIKENGNIREFNLLDYYLLTNINPNTILDVLNKYEKDDAYLFNLFIEKYKDSKLLTTIDIKNILNEKDYIYSYINKDDISILNTEISRKDTLIVLDYLKEHNIPLFDVIYKIALKKYLNEKLILSNKDISKKNRWQICNFYL